MCNILGTHRSAIRTCHPVTGQCQCLPHVIGIDCGSCEPNYWKLASGQGCEPCGCDRSGSSSSQCNEVIVIRNSLIRSFTHSFIHLFFHSLVRSFTFVYFFTHEFIQFILFSCLLTLLIQQKICKTVNQILWLKQMSDCCIMGISKRIYFLFLLLFICFLCSFVQS